MTNIYFCATVMKKATSIFLLSLLSSCICSSVEDTFLEDRSSPGVFALISELMFIFCSPIVAHDILSDCSRHSSRLASRAIYDTFLRVVSSDSDFPNFLSPSCPFLPERGVFFEQVNATRKY